jgi:hypothetical protein
MWGIDMHQLNPNGRSLLDFFQALGKRYRFAKYPQHLLDYNSAKALEFNSGTFLKSPTEDLRVGLTIYNDGIVGDSLSSTNDSESFLRDMAKWAAQEHNLTFDMDTITRTSYLSQLEVKGDFDLLLENPKLTFVRSKLSSQAATLDGNPVKFNLGGLVIAPDDMGKDKALQPFRLERKWGRPSAENIYFSQASLQTQEHITLLNEIEAALK